MEISRTDNRYSDFDFDFTAHPVTGDLVRKVDREAVKQAVRNLVLLHRGEIGFNPIKGSGIHKLLFEQLSPNMDQAISRMITDALKNHEPRINLNQLVIDDERDPNGIFLDLIFTVINIPEPIRLSIFFERVR